MVPKSLATAAAILAGAAGGVHAEDTVGPSAFMDAYVYACQPVEYDFAGREQPLDETAQRIYDELYVGKYARSCLDFFYHEVVGFIDAERQPYFTPVEFW